MFAEKLDTNKALQIGLIDEIVDNKEELLKAALDRARFLFTKNQTVLNLIKLCTNYLFDKSYQKQVFPNYLNPFCIFMVKPKRGDYYFKTCLQFLCWTSNITTKSTRKSTKRTFKFYGNRYVSNGNFS